MSGWWRNPTVRPGSGRTKAEVIRTAEISKTADQALSVLTTLGARGPMNPAELSRALGLNRTVVHRLLTTLLQRGFVGRSEHGYTPGVMLLRMAERVQPELRVAATPVMKDLVDTAGETVVLHVPDGEDAVVLQQAVSAHHVVRVEHEIGSRHALSLGASGRALLGFQASALVDRVLTHTERPDLLRSQLESVRQLGYAISHDELQDGVYGVAVPILDESGRAIASLAILVPITRANALTAHIDELSQAAGRIAKAFSGSSHAVNMAAG